MSFEIPVLWKHCDNPDPFVSERCWLEVVSQRGPTDKVMMSAFQFTAPFLQMSTWLRDSLGKHVCLNYSRFLIYLLRTLQHPVLCCE